MAAHLPERHFGYTCRKCGASEFTGRRYACWACIDYQICGRCYDAGNLPESPEHKYYHPLETHYTRAEYQLYFGGEFYDESNVPQSYKCALCECMGFNIEELYMHLYQSHMGHKDFEEYFRILYSRMSADSVEFSLPPVVEAQSPLPMLQTPPPPPPPPPGPPAPDTAPPVPERALSPDPPGPRRFILEIIRLKPIVNNSRDSSSASRRQRRRCFANLDAQYNPIVEQALQLLDELHGLNRNDSNFDSLSQNILERARSLRRISQRHSDVSPGVRGSLDVGSSPGNHYDAETILRIIEDELTAAQTTRDAPTTRGSLLSRRRNAVGPNSSVAMAARLMAASYAETATVPSATLTSRGGGMLRGQSLRTPRPFNSDFETLRTGFHDAGSAFRRYSSPIDLARTRSSQQRPSSRNWDGYIRAAYGFMPMTAGSPGSGLSARAAMTPRATMFREVPDHFVIPPSEGSTEIQNQLQKRYADIVREMVATNDFRPMLMKVRDPLADQANKSSQKTPAATKPEEKPTTQQTSKNDGKFLCKRFLKVEKMKSEHQKTNIIKHAGFTEALLLSMLADEELAQVQINIDWESIPKTVFKMPETTKVEAPKEDNADKDPASKTGVEAMARFLRGLDFYKSWLETRMAETRIETNGKNQDVCKQMTASEHLPETRFAYDDDEIDETDERTDENEDQQTGEDRPNNNNNNLSVQNNDFVNTAAMPVPIDDVVPSPIIYIDSDMDDSEEDDDENDGEGDDETGGDDEVSVVSAGNPQPLQSVAVYNAAVDVQQVTQANEANGEHDAEYDDEIDGDMEEVSSDTSEGTIAMMVNEIDEVYGY
ncbi:uncharacterized protein LOC115626252 [Scaptodrosophila lebanonensis]|uniref:RING-type E3 ubiquitin transferase n=1 Tax=Drosophila lebanonensis TaxID=7225 RepID=A0A6J2TQL4_DROLE|nr:uncharacterized protein LOC115626252 [Scaptodrosophila lebanonensis]XP_030377407.1 uncharacterized protein LOC115626252 [Scaptodrosophila lebanonensis]XP_030377408.1 uncharacterized protein LOC115626252 [Scaptodrosophila lebanonensis]